MPKRPRTSESLDAMSMAPSTSSSLSKWSLKRFSKKTQSSQSRIENSTLMSATSSSSSPLIFDNRGIFQPSAAHHYKYSPDDVEESIAVAAAAAAAAAAAVVDEGDHRGNHGYLKPEDTNYLSEKNSAGRSPGAKAKELVNHFSSFVTGKLNSTKRSPSKHRDAEMTTTQSGETFWSSHNEFTTALALQENAPTLEVKSDVDAIAIEDEISHDFNEFSGDSSSASNNSAHMSSPWHSPTPTLLMHFPISPKTVSDRTSYNGNVISPIQDRSLTLEDFEVLETLGTGTFGRVLLVRQKSSDPDDRRNYFAMKVLKKEHIVRLKQIEHINSERNILLKTDHPFLVKMKCTFQDSINCYMLMEFVVGGEIFTHLRRQKRFPVDVTRFYIATLVLAVSYLHSKGIIYRDLKPENLLIDDQGYIKITDFGFAKELIGTDRTWTLCGTPEYLSPEVIQSQGQTFACDYWCLGVLMYEMLCGHPPFFGSTPFGTYEKILAAKLYFPNHVDMASRDLISSLLTVDVSKRLGNLRGGAFDVMNHPWFRGVDWHMLLHKKLPAPIRPHQDHPSDSSNFEKYNSFDLSNMPGMHLGLDADRLELQRDPFNHLFSSF